MQQQRFCSVRGLVTCSGSSCEHHLQQLLLFKHSIINTKPMNRAVSLFTFRLTASQDEHMRIIWAKCKSEACFIQISALLQTPINDVMFPFIGANVSYLQWCAAVAVGIYSLKVRRKTSSLISEWWRQWRRHRRGRADSWSVVGCWDAATSGKEKRWTYNLLYLKITNQTAA